MPPPLPPHALRSGCASAALCSSCPCGPKDPVGLNGYGLAVTMQQECGLQAAEAWILYGANEFPDSLFDSLNGGWWNASGLFGTVAAGGRLCGRKAALLSPTRHRYASIVLPGPAFRVIPGGRAILAVEFAWARHWLRSARVLLPRGSKDETASPKQPTIKSMRRRAGFLLRQASRTLLPNKKIV